LVLWSITVGWANYRDVGMASPQGIVPELDVTNIDDSLVFYVDVCGFVVLYARPEERFAYLSRGSAELMLEEAGGPGRRFHRAPLERPFGRGMNLQIRVDDVDALYAAVVRSAAVMTLDIEERWYRVDGEEAGNRQFVVSDPDGYLLRFFEDLGRRKPAM
jgi:catechol 2,3-dioxygenase-like lactoylglutathione lyase family enzyme